MDRELVRNACSCFLLKTRAERRAAGIIKPASRELQRRELLRKQPCEKLSDVATCYQRTDKSA